MCLTKISREIFVHLDRLQHKEDGIGPNPIAYRIRDRNGGPDKMAVFLKGVKGAPRSEYTIGEARDYLTELRGRSGL